MTFRWPICPKLTFFHQTNIFIWFLDPKNPLKLVSYVILTFFVFLANSMIYYIIFDPLAENVQDSSLRKLAVVLGPCNLSKSSYGDWCPGRGTKVMLAPGLKDFYETGTLTFSIIVFLLQHFFAVSLSDIHCNILH